MKLGFLTNYAEEEVKFASEVGFTSLSFNARPGTSLEPGKVTPEEIEKIKETVKRYGIYISAIGYYANPLDPDKEKRRETIDYLLKVLDICKMLDVKVFTGFPGRGAGISVKENISLFKEVFSSIVEKATDNGIKIAFENCHGGGASSPDDWEAIFEAIPSTTLGLEMDPSHLVWQGIDYIKAIYDFGERIYHVHAKDTQILQDILDRKGILGKGWWRFRIPGWGDIDWNQFISALVDVGYDGAISIEHEDPVFSGKRRKEGLILGFKHLSQFMVL